jgi:putative ABC transport system permease protein
LMVLREGLALTLAGILVAVPLVAFGASYLEKLLSKMKPLEPASIFTALVVLLMAALIAVGLPAFRAAGVDPAETLRQE